jgi:pimeloyl-ACP methyl ester carboxylesterase
LEKANSHKLLKKAGRIAACVFAGSGALLALGAIFEAVASASDSVNYPPPGQLVNVNGHGIHIHCAGEGSPTVIMEAGGGDSSMSWSEVQSEVSNFTRVCSYDRLGLAWSDDTNSNRTSKAAADELRSLLVAAGEKGPYVLVGHSLGGFTMRIFASDYPGDVVGMVLVDPSDENMFTASELSGMAGTFRSESMMARFGVMRLFGANIIPSVLGAPLPVDYAKNIPIVFGPKSLNTAADEIEAIKESQAYVKQVSGEGSFGSKPLLIISADNDYSRESGFMDFHKTLTRLSTNSSHVAAEGPHHLHWVNQAIVVESISAVIG